MSHRRSKVIRAATIVAVAAALFLAGALRAELPEWVQNLDAGVRWYGAFIRLAPMPAVGTVPIARPPAETRVALAGQIVASPRNAELYRLRAFTEEQLLDFNAAAADWQKYVQLSGNSQGAELALADFYHRRLRPLDEVKALHAAALAPPPPRDRLLPTGQQEAWRALDRIIRLADLQSLPPSVALAEYRAWIARYPKEPAAYERFLSFLVQQKQVPEAEKLIADYRNAFPDDGVFPVKARAAIEEFRGSAARALEVYDRAFQPLWPAELVQSYFRLLDQTHRKRDFLARARAALAKNPDDLDAAARIFYYYQQQGNLDPAQRPLVDMVARHEASGAGWAPDALYTVGQLFEGAQNYDEAARCYYALYSLPPGASAGAPDAPQKALAGIFNVLVTVPERPIAFGAGDLSMYRDIATMDAHPGFLNGVLSLILNTTQPSWQYSTEEQSATAYYHRARAAQLLALFDKRFPAAARRDAMHASLIYAYDTYGESDAAIRAGRAFLAAFPSSGERVRVAMTMATAYARKNDVRNEFATYDALLKELAERVGGVPLGDQGQAGTPQPAASPDAEGEPVSPGDGEGEGAEGAAAPPARPGRWVAPRAMPPGGGPQGSAGPRSPEYARVLDRYIARLAALKRPMDALALYRRELDRNPADPGLYERLASFMDQNRMAADVEQVYRRAIQEFRERAWWEKLARWYLRHKQTAAFDRLTQDVVKIFSGSDLEKYFAQVVGQGNVDARLYLQLNEYAHQRFPENLSFVHNLLAAYGRRETWNPAGTERLLRSYWFYDDTLRAPLFAMLASSGRLDTEMSAVRAMGAASVAAGRWKDFAAANPAAVQFIAEGEAWQAHFENAAPPLEGLSEVYPAHEGFVRRAANLERSLDESDGSRLKKAVAFEDALHRYEPRDHAPLTRLGEIYADREAYAQAKPYWSQIAEIEPGNRQGYIEAATVFWDYFQFDDALRLIGDARRKFNDPALFAYEAGAVRENRREPVQAIEEYVRGALADEGGSSARSRLLRLARRPKLDITVREQAAKAAQALTPPAISLYAAVLEAQARRPDLEAFLLAAAGQTASLDVLSSVSEIAERQGLDKVRERVFERRVALSADPVERMRVRLALARFYESRNDRASAAKVIETLYAENPRSLGVVRATVDFYWRGKMPARAVEVLLQSSRRANEHYRRQFAFEAARKDTDAGLYPEAAQLLEGLLKDKPFDAEFLAAVADNLARQGNDTALRDFYTATIAALAKAPMDAAGRTARVAQLRRGLIPALTRLKDYSGAIDQYIELINQYPEDEALPREAALAASDHQLAQKLTGFYEQTAKTAPRDYRWPIVLARVYTALEDFPQAIGSYGRAIQVRPDRVDLHIARASLEERLLRFADAARGYTQIYELTYHNRQWMEKVAEVRARQGQPDAAVAALKRALIEGREQQPAQWFEAARRLDSWNMLAPARQFAEQGVKLAGEHLLDAEAVNDVQAYARILARSRDYQAVFATLHGLARPDPERAMSALSAACRDIGDVARVFYTPEEKQALVAFLGVEKASAPAQEFEQALWPLVQQADLAELEVNWRVEAMMRSPGPGGDSHERRVIQLQTSRMKFAELGRQLQEYYRVYPPDQSQRSAIMQEAAGAYRSAGDSAAEMRVLAQVFQEGGLSQVMERRYFTLLAQRAPAQLIAAAGPGHSRDRRSLAANTAVLSGKSGIAYQAVAARGQGLPPVWTRGYTALTGLYYADPAAVVADAFAAALGPRTIAEQLAKPADRNQQLTGEVWFYYAGRYGEYLDVTSRPSGDDYLPADVEGAPARASAYFTLADYYRERGRPAEALAEYAHTLELDPLAAAAHDRVAGILWPQNQRDQAVAAWRRALQTYAKIEDRGRLPDTFWTGLEATLEHIGEHRLLPALRPDADRVLRTYIRHNGWYNTEPLLRGALAAAADPAAGIEWIAGLGGAASDPAQFLSELLQRRWVPESARGVLYDRMIAAAEARVAREVGQARAYAENEWRGYQWQRIDYLLGARQAEKARAALEAIPAEARQTTEGYAGYQVRLAALTGGLDALLERLRQDPAVRLDVVRQAADRLRADGEEALARKVLEFVYTTSLERQDLSAANFLGLAEIRLQAGNNAAALPLLKRMTLVSGAAFETQASAADLLEKFNRWADAQAFLEERVKAVPWDIAARVRLDNAALRAGGAATAPRDLAAVAALPDAPYSERAAAARLLAQNRAPAASAGSEELAVMAAGTLAPAAVEKPFFYFARLNAAARTNDAATQLRLLLGAAALTADPAAEVRVRLFRAAYDDKRYALAVSSLDELLRHGAFGFAAVRDDGAQDGERSPEREAPPAGSFMNDLNLDQPTRASLARDLADACERTGRLRPALTFLHVAEELQPAGAARAAITRARESLAARIKRGEENARRRPVIAENLNQARVVRPRVEAETAQRRTR